jgi:MFS family permease
MTCVGQLFHVYIFFTLSGLAFAFFWPSLENWVAEGKSYEEILKSIGIYNMAWSTGLLLGPATGGFLFEKGMGAPFYFASAVAGTLGIFLLFISRPNNPEMAVIETQNKSYIPRQNNRYLMLGWISNFISWFILGNIRNIFPKLATSMGISPGTLGVLISTVGLAQIFSFYFIRRWEGWHYRFFPLLAFQAMAAAGMLFIYFGRSSLVLAFGMAAIGISNGMTYYSSIFYSLHRDRKRGLAAGLHETIIATGGLLGPLLGGFVASYHLRWPYPMCLVLIAIGITVEWLILEK